MRMKKNKIIFWVIWSVLVFLGFYTISKTPIVSTLNLLQRASGVLIFTLLFIQIVLGKSIHPIIYLLAVIHPLFQLIFNYKLFHILVPFYIYTQVCFLCKNKTELFYTFGRLAFWFLTIGVFAARKKLYIFNYFAFFFVALHGWFVGSDFRLSPLKYVFWLSVAVVFLTAARKVLLKKEKGL